MAGMETEFPQSVREAEEHIRQIRRDKGLGDGPEQIGNNASDLESALELCVSFLNCATLNLLAKHCPYSFMTVCRKIYIRQPPIFFLS
jgi:hypothetical protein